MRSRVPLFAFVLTIGTVVVPHFAHAAIPFFGPIIPDAYNRCPAGWGLFIPVINNIIEFALTIAIVFIAPLMIAYSGFLFVVNPVNASGKEKAKGILLNTIVGIVIALAGWLIVDAVLTALTNQGVSAWTDLISRTGASPCLSLAGSLSNAGGTTGGVSGISANGTQNFILPSNGNCSANSIQAAVQGTSYALSSSQAQTLSCIALPESSCGTNTTGAQTPQGTPTYAAGMFQIVTAFNDTCHNLNTPQCSAAAGISGNLNCSQAYTNCNGTTCDIGNQTLFNQCQAAAANLSCNVSAASCLIQANNGSFGAWTGDSRSSAQAQCVQQFASGG